MKLFIRLAFVFIMFVLLLVVTLLPTWSVSAASHSEGAVTQITESVQPVQSLAVITFTPVATVYLPLVKNGEGAPTPEPGGPTDVKIIRIVYNPAGDDVDGEYVEIQNFGASAVDMTAWTLRDIKDHIFTFPSFSLNTQAKVRVWVKSGSDDAANLYWGINSPVWNNSGEETAILRNAADEEIDSCTYSGDASGFVECN